MSIAHAVQSWPADLQRRPWRPEDGDSRCQECGRANPVWWAEDEVWNLVMGGDAQREAGGILCPTCFIIKATERGHCRSGAWQLYPPAPLM